jgi:hypothetical protein
MPIRTLLQVRKDILAAPIVDECAFRLGDTVTFTNDSGVVFNGNKIIGFDDGRGLTFKYGSHIYLNSDAYWSPHKDEQLTLETRLTDDAHEQLVSEHGANRKSKNNLN